MNCYKCGTDKELSKRGNTSYMCRQCRRNEYQERKLKNPKYGCVDPELIRFLDWDIKARKVHKHLVERFS